ncbi:MAG: UvrD-helicase domain-containing protein [Actinomycetota bacterium]
MTPPLSPDPQQERVLAHDAGAMLVTGGPGTGKTAILRERFARLLEGGADPERVAFVVGSAPARNAEREALLARFQGSLPELRVVTIHGLARHVLNARFRRLDYPEPPDLLPAGDQFALVQDLLNDQDPAAWPAYGHMLGMRAFADEIRQFLSRAQEALLTPEDIEARADKAGLTGWKDLARFYREYQDVIDGRNIVDFAALLQRAAQVSTDGEPLLDHLLVDDYQDSTFAAEAIVAGLAPTDLIVAGDPEAHVFSFQGTTDIPIRRFAERFGGADVIELETPHRAPTAVTIEAWTAPHTSEEHASVARELRRLHVEEGVPWNELAVVVRRQGPHLGSLLRALDDAGVPRALPESGMALTAEPATFPYVLALRWLTADTEARERLIESVLTSDLVRLSPAAARGLMRAAQAAEGTIGAALEHTDGLTQAEAAEVDPVRDVLARAATVADRSVLDAFRILWQDLPYSSRLVADAERSPDARREIDVVVGLSRMVAEAGDSPDPSTQAFVRSLDAGEHGPGYRATDPTSFDAVRVLTAHGAVGTELDTVVVAGAVEGNFPSLSRPEPMFDLAALERPISQSERNRARLEDERRLFRMMLGRARSRVVLTASETHTDGSVATSRFVDEQGVAWTPMPQGPFEEPVSVREATATWRRTLADLDVPRARRLAALEGLVALGVDPRRWWFQRGWTDTGAPLHEAIRVSYSKLSTLENCELQYVLSAELGLGSLVGYQAWVGKTVHKIIEDCENGAVDRTLEKLKAEVDVRWRPQEFPSTAVSETWRRLAKDRMLPNWFDRFGEHPATGTERGFEFEYDGVTLNGFIDRIGPDPLGFGTRITDYKTGGTYSAPKANESLQLGIYYLAAQEADDLKEVGAVTGVELAYLKGHYKTGDIEMREWEVGSGEREAEYQQRMRERLTRLIAELRRLDEEERYRPSSQADCFFCDFKTLCSLYPQGAPLFPTDGGS